MESWRMSGGAKNGSGRSRLTAKATDKKLVLACKRNRFQSVPELTIGGLHQKCSDEMCVPLTDAWQRRKYVLSVQQSECRCQTTTKKLEAVFQEHSNCSEGQWRAVMWSDESRFTLDFHDGCSNIHRLPGQRFARYCLREHDR